MVKRFMPTKDLELLSAYLDEELKPNDREKLQHRLNQDSLLLDELNHLRRTRAVIRRLPSRKAPRNFTLTAEMVPVRKPVGNQPIFGFVSAVSILLLLVIFVSDFLVIPEYIGMFSVSRAPSASIESTSAERAVEGEPLVFPTELPTPTNELNMKIQEAEPMGGGAESSLQAEEVPLGTPQAPMLESAPSAADEIPSTEAVRMFALEVTPTPGVAEILGMDQKLAPTAAVAEDVVTQEPVSIDSAPVMVEQTNTLESRLWLQLLIWMVEVFLLLVALGSGLVVVYFRVKRRF